MRAKSIIQDASQTADAWGFLYEGESNITPERTSWRQQLDGQTRSWLDLDEGPSVKVTMGKVLTLSPPLTVTGEKMDTALDIIDETIGWVSSQ